MPLVLPILIRQTSRFQLAEDGTRHGWCVRRGRFMMMPFYSVFG